MPLQHLSESLYLLSHSVQHLQDSLLLPCRWSRGLFLQNGTSQEHSHCHQMMPLQRCTVLPPGPCRPRALSTMSSVITQHQA